MDSNSNKKQMDDPLQTITEEKIREACGQIIFERAFEYVCSENLSLFRSLGLEKNISK